MPKIIATVQVKGGAGRTTLATNLAAELAKKSRTVLVDADLPMAGSSTWYALRQAAGREGNLELETAATYRELAAVIERNQDADYLVLDGTPRVEEITRLLFAVADLALVPLVPAGGDVYATTDLLKVIEAAKKTAKVDARLVWTRVMPRTRLFQEMLDLAATELALPAMETMLLHRVAYQEANSRGLTGTEVGNAEAKRETQSLVAEALKILRKGK